MTTEIQAEANRRNALHSTGPRTAEGIETARFNALRHGLRSLQTVVPGEAPEEWESHRAAVVGDLKPLGAVELALAELIAVKLWRLGRVVRHEADMISIGQDQEDLALTHEIAHQGKNEYLRRKQGIANRENVQDAASALRIAREKLKTGVLHSFRAQGVQAPRSPFWRSKRPAQLGGIEASGSCHNIVVTTD